MLVTGVAGFIGFHIAEALLKNGFSVIGIDNLNDYYDVKLKLHRLNKLGISIDELSLNSNNKHESENFIFLYSDISEEKTWHDLNSYKIYKVIHLAAQAGVRYSLINPKAYINSNIVGFQLLLDYCVENQIQDLLYASSSSVYGINSVTPFNESESCTSPESLYAATKKANELMSYAYFKTKGLSSIGLRFFTVYGPLGRPDMLPMLFANAVSKNLPIEIYNNGNQSRDFTYIDDIVRGVIGCFNYVVDGKLNGSIVMNIGRGEPIPLLDFIDIMERKTNRIAVKIFKEAQPGDVMSTYSDNSLIFELTGYKPIVSLDEGVTNFFKWYESYFN